MIGYIVAYLAGMATAATVQILLGNLQRRRAYATLDLTRRNRPGTGRVPLTGSIRYAGSYAKGVERATPTSATAGRLKITRRRV